jgi:response regulator RpfG family c-di-GMP phosphodiesterase
VTSEAILFVDDEELLLSSYQRVLRKQFQFDVAKSGQEALDKFRSTSYAVIVSDMRMPGMNGVELLKQIRSTSPETVRLMLTGNSDIQTAIEAVNEGCVFRFLTKPCSPDSLANAINDGLQQYRLIRSEKDLLEQTLHGSIRVLTEVLSIVNPTAFNQSLRAAEYVKAVVRQLKLSNEWQYEVAAMLSNIGRIVLPKESLETPRFAAHVPFAQNLLSKIPRLESIAAMIGGLAVEPGQRRTSAKGTDDAVHFGTEILRTCHDFQRLLLEDMSPKAALKILRETSGGHYLPAIIDALAAVSNELFQYEPTCRKMADLNEQMILDQDLRTVHGTVLVTRGTPITHSLLLRLHSFRERKLLPAEVHVLIPSAR